MWGVTLSRNATLKTKVFLYRFFVGDFGCERDKRDSVTCKRNIVIYKMKLLLLYECKNGLI